MKVKTIAEIAEIQAGYSFRGSIADTPTGQTAVVQASNIDADSLAVNTSALKSVTDEPTKEAAYLAQGDIIVAARGSVLGGLKSAVFGGNQKRTIASSSVYIIRLRDDSRISPDFFSLYLNSSAGQSRMAKKSVGTLIQTILKKDIAELEIPIPEPAVQETLVQLYRNIRTQEQALEEKKRIMEEILAGVLQNTLTH